MEVPDSAFTPVSSIGEFGLIDRIRRILPAASDDVLIGIGDDAAVVAIRGSADDRDPENLPVQLITTDALIEHVHFDRTYTPLRHLGFKSLAVNVSDIAAMNGRARFATIAIGLPNSISVEMVESIFKGLAEAAVAYGVAIVGGDVTGSHKLVISVTVIGECSAGRLSRRSGASPGDLLCVSGTLGASYAGLRILQHHKERMLEEGEGYHPDLSIYSSVIERQLRPKARTDIVAALADAGVTPTAMIDLSDGLASDLRHIAVASACGFDVELDLLPVSDETRLVAETLEDSLDRYSLQGGEDYELLFTVDPGHESSVAAIGDVTIVGVCLDEGDGLRVTRGGHSEDLPDPGFVHF